MTEAAGNILVQILTMNPGQNAPPAAQRENPERSFLEALMACFQGRATSGNEGGREQGIMECFQGQATSRNEGGSEQDIIECCQGRALSGNEAVEGESILECFQRSQARESQEAWQPEAAAIQFLGARIPPSESAHVMERESESQTPNENVLENSDQAGTGLARILPSEQTEDRGSEEVNQEIVDQNLFNGSGALFALLTPSGNLSDVHPHLQSDDVPIPIHETENRALRNEARIGREVRTPEEQNGGFPQRSIGFVSEGDQDEKVLAQPALDRKVQFVSNFPGSLDIPHVLDNTGSAQDNVMANREVAYEAGTTGEVRPLGQQDHKFAETTPGFIVENGQDKVLPSRNLAKETGTTGEIRPLGQGDYKFAETTPGFIVENGQDKGLLSELIFDRKVQPMNVISEAMDVPEKPDSSGSTVDGATAHRASADNAGIPRDVRPLGQHDGGFAEMTRGFLIENQQGEKISADVLPDKKPQSMSILSESSGIAQSRDSAVIPAKGTAESYPQGNSTAAARDFRLSEPSPVFIKNGEFANKLERNGVTPQDENEPFHGPKNMRLGEEMAGSVSSTSPAESEGTHGSTADLKLEVSSNGTARKDANPQELTGNLPGVTQRQVEINQPTRNSQDRAFATGIMEKVEEGMQHFLRTGENRMEIRLHPPALGQLRIEINVSADRVSATFVADNTAVKGILEANAGRLRDALQEHGLHMESFQVNVNSQGSRHSNEYDTSSQSYFRHNPDATEDEPYKYNPESPRGERQIARVNGLSIFV